jgi:two-component system, NarL family, invasion response regulator UvrY
MGHPKIRLVLVDDHEMVRNTWKLILQQDIRIDIVAECSSGAEAIEIAAELLPDVMLMDINMSPVNGFEATRKIVKSCPEVKIIGVSVNDQPGYARNMLQLGARGFVTKNTSHEEMAEAIFEVFRGRTFICKELRDKMNSDNF